MYVLRTVAVNDGSADERAAAAAERVVQRMQDHLCGRPVVDGHRQCHVRTAGSPHARVCQP